MHPDICYIIFYSTILNNLVTILLKVLYLASYISNINIIDYTMLFHFISSICYVDFLLLQCVAYARKCWPILCLPVSCIDSSSSSFSSEISVQYAWRFWWLEQLSLLSCWWYSIFLYRYNPRCTVISFEKYKCLLRQKI